MQEGQSHQIVDRGNISFISPFHTVFQCCSVLEGKLARAADGVDLDPESIHRIDNSRFPDLGRVADPDALAGLGHSLRVDLQHWPIQGKLETTALPRRRPSKQVLGYFCRLCRRLAGPRNRRFALPLWAF